MKKILPLISLPLGLSSCGSVLTTRNGFSCGGISPADVARAMCASRTLADALFRKALGHTILDEIHAVRIRTAQDMLARGVQPDIVAQNCGYASTNDFRRVFKRRTGKTIRQWRKDGAPV